MKKILLLPDGTKPPVWTKIDSITKRIGYDIVTGENDIQHFVEYWKNKKRRGMILRPKGEKFWGVWKFKNNIPVIQTKKVRPAEWITVGSKNKAVAIKKLREMI